MYSTPRPKPALLCREPLTASQSAASFAWAAITRPTPFYFTKPADAVMDAPCTMPYPQLTQDLHHEIELVLAIGKDGADIAPEAVMDHIWGAAVGLDMTRRDLQGVAKSKGRPWDWGKGFDHSAPMGAIKPIAEVPSLTQGRIWMAVNGEIRQDDDIGNLIWSIAEHVSILSQAMALKAGDLVMTGTPAGVGAVVEGDVITGGVDGVGTLEVTIGSRA